MFKTSCLKHRHPWFEYCKTILYLILFLILLMLVFVASWESTQHVETVRLRVSAGNLWDTVLQVKQQRQSNTTNLFGLFPERVASGWCAYGCRDPRATPRAESGAPSDSATPTSLVSRLRRQPSRLPVSRHLRHRLAPLSLPSLRSPLILVDGYIS